jgi:hypothetical protein
MRIHKSTINGVTTKFKEGGSPMKKLLWCFLGALILSFGCDTRVVVAGEHPGEAVEHPGEAVKPAGKKITADVVKKSIKENIDAQSTAQGGVFIVHDDKLNKNWRLDAYKIHDPVRSFVKGGQTIYFACVDFKSLDGPDVLDIDFWMVPRGNTLVVIDTKIHKVNGKPRYTYEGTETKEIK